MERMLVVGGDGLLGGALTTYWRSLGFDVLATSRRISRSPSDVRLDLADAAGWNPPEGIGVAVICAAQARAHECKADPEGTRLVNVVGTVEVASRLVERGAFVVHLSSTHVFDGAESHRKATEPPSPVTEYGNQKVEAEAALTELGLSQVAILRISKLLGPTPDPIAGWAASLRRAEPIAPFADMRFAPIPLKTVLSVITLLGLGRHAGIYQLSGERDISYADAAALGARWLGVDESLVRPVKARDANPNIANLPLHTTFDTSRVRAAVGVEPPDIEWTLEQAFCRPEVLGP